MERADDEDKSPKGEGAGNKRGFEDIEDPTPADFAQMSRSERKRHREKRRRSKVNSGFDDLKSLLVEIDNETNEREEINRVDLIARAVVVMKTMHQDNLRMKAQIRDMPLSAADQVTIAVPYLIPKDTTTTTMHQHHVPPPPHHGGSPHHGGHHHSMGAPPPPQPHQPPPYHGGPPNY